MRIQVIGAGSWGLALARLLALKGHQVYLWARDEDFPDELREKRYSPLYLTHVFLPQEIEISREIQSSVDMAVFAVPSHVMRNVASRFNFSSQTIRVNVAKGIETGTLLRMSQVLQEVHGTCPIATLSGPSHAEEVAEDKPTSVVVASSDENLNRIIQDVFMTPFFRVYTSTDIIGVELGGALKNVIAIAAGVCDGLQLGDNAKAALITRGLAEITRLGVCLGADPLTFAGLSGLGDLIVTCNSKFSRNRFVGEKIAQRIPLEKILETMKMVAEGVNTTRSAYEMSLKYEVEMPITYYVYRTLFENLDPLKAVSDLMSRNAKPEWWK